MDGKSLKAEWSAVEGILMLLREALGCHVQGSFGLLPCYMTGNIIHHFASLGVFAQKMVCVYSI